ncbi:Phd finger domain-containing protein [Operophtera brumata]|uniref:Phd finger domain-containing protein n=1 Tax=Operophtera brumata TaxID=104452 RepID=A0A0L7KSV3_OPEBR|nr:Phd finger domain-containing protein [Operophtera brumata]
MTYKLNSDYSDLSIMINGMDKENLPMKPDELHLMDIRTASEDEPDSDSRYSQRDVQLSSQALLSGLLSSPSAASLELPISTSELERLAKSVQGISHIHTARLAGATQRPAVKPERGLSGAAHQHLGARATRQVCSSSARRRYSAACCQARARPLWSCPSAPRSSSDSASLFKVYLIYIQLGSQALLSGLLSSPSAASLELPISTSELERLGKSVQEAAAADWQAQAAAAPQPEAPIENEVCRDRLLKHIQRCQALLDSRLDSIEAQVAELESQEPSFGEQYETAEHYPRIKQTVQMLMRDLDTMEELGVIT